MCRTPPADRPRYADIGGSAPFPHTRFGLSVKVQQFPAEFMKSEMVRLNRRRAKSGSGRSRTPIAPIRRVPEFYVSLVTPAQHLGRLPHFDDAVARQHAAKIRPRINNAIAPNNGTGIEDRVASDFGTISDYRTKFSQASRNHSVGCEDGNLRVIEFDVGEDGARAEVRLVTEDRVAHVAKMRNLRGRRSRPFFSGAISRARC